MLYRYFFFNKNKDDFYTIGTKFYNRLIKRNYIKDVVKKEFIKSVQSFSILKSTTYNLTTYEDKVLIIKDKYFKGLRRSKLFLLASKHLPFMKEMSNLPFNKLTIAFKKKNNLKEILFPLKLYIPIKLYIDSIRKDPYNIYYLYKSKLLKKNKIFNILHVYYKLIYLYSYTSTYLDITFIYIYIYIY